LGRWPQDAIVNTATAHNANNFLIRLFANLLIALYTYAKIANFIEPDEQPKVKNKKTPSGSDFYVFCMCDTGDRKTRTASSFVEGDAVLLVGHQKERLTCGGQAS
jgi:hypothetical protein